MPHHLALSGAERQVLVRHAVDLAGERFASQGFNCAESVLYGVATALGLSLPPELLRAATPFGGGLGHAGCICGALSGGILALGIACGRTTADAGQKDEAYAHAQRLWQRFVERAGAEDCRDLNTLGFGHPDQKPLCARFVAIAAEAAAEELLGAQS